MSKSNVFENDLLKLIFNATPIAGLADNAASSPVTSLFLALHTADHDEDVPPDAATSVASADQLRTALTAEYERRMQAIAAGYPPSERESWPVQTSEAYSLLADSTVSTPWIDAASTARGLDRIELAQRIVAKDTQYRVISGTLSGVRQRIEDQIDAAGDDQAALQAIDVTAGWPEA